MYLSGTLLGIHKKNITLMLPMKRQVLDCDNSHTPEMVWLFRKQITMMNSI